MIHTIEFTNYRIFSSPQRLRLAPLTVIFGKNNTGKSVIQDSHIGTDIIQRISTSKKLEQPQQIQEIQTTNMWKNRFQNWYSAIDRVSQNSKGKFLKMKADIVKAISDKFKLRDNNRNIDNQDKDI